MTEQEWKATVQVAPLLRHVDGKVSVRKLRLFACACFRAVSRCFRKGHARRMLEIAEQLAEGAEIPANFEQTIYAARRSLEGTVHAWTFLPLLHVTGPDLTTTSATDLAKTIWHESPLGSAETHRLLVGLFREVIGNPFRPVAIDPTWLSPAVVTGDSGRPIAFDAAWLTRTVVSLAQAAYEERKLPGGTLDNDRLAILADALEDAGCTDAELLEHLREPLPHVRGCWCVDLLLKKS